jgi:CBS domain-containing protein
MKPVIDLLGRRPPAIYQVAPGVMVFDALQLLADHGVGALLVMEEGRLVGIFSERDYTRKVALQGRNSRDTPVSAIMTASVIAVPPQTGVRDCMALMRKHHFRHLPVVEGGRVLGMISIRDIMDDIIADHELTISQLQSYISS